jgi:hypothetical protein
MPAYYSLIKLASCSSVVQNIKLLCRKDSLDLSLVPRMQKLKAGVAAHGACIFMKKLADRSKSHQQAGNPPKGSDLQVSKSPAAPPPEEAAKNVSQCNGGGSEISSGRSKVWSALKQKGDGSAVAGIAACLQSYCQSGGPAGVPEAPMNNAGATADCGAPSLQQSLDTVHSQEDDANGSLATGPAPTLGGAQHISSSAAQLPPQDLPKERPPGFQNSADPIMYRRGCLSAGNIGYRHRVFAPPHFQDQAIANLEHHSRTLGFTSEAMNYQLRTQVWCILATVPYLANDSLVADGRGAHCMMLLLLQDPLPFAASASMGNPAACECSIMLKTPYAATALEARQARGICSFPGSPGHESPPPVGRSPLGQTTIYTLHAICPLAKQAGEQYAAATLISPPARALAYKCNQSSWTGKNSRPLTQQPPASHGLGM